MPRTALNHASTSGPAGAAVKEEEKTCTGTCTGRVGGDDVEGLHARGGHAQAGRGDLGTQEHEAVELARGHRDTGVVDEHPAPVTGEPHGSTAAVGSDSPRHDFTG